VAGRATQLGRQPEPVGAHLPRRGARRGVRLRHPRLRRQYQPRVRGHPDRRRGASHRDHRRGGGVRRPTTPAARPAAAAGRRAARCGAGRRDRRRLRRRGGPGRQGGAPGGLRQRPDRYQLDRQPTVTAGARTRTDRSRRDRRGAGGSPQRRPRAGRPDPGAASDGRGSRYRRRRFQLPSRPARRPRSRPGGGVRHSHRPATAARAEHLHRHRGDRRAGRDLRPAAGHHRRRSAGRPHRARRRSARPAVPRAGGRRRRDDRPDPAHLHPDRTAGRYHADQQYVRDARRATHPPVRHAARDRRQPPKGRRDDPGRGRRDRRARHGHRDTGRARSRPPHD